ncbi:MAG: zinc ribbon domain-containing protein [Euryarchaeota archaeon]|nr:zinc ribbon domain-containing protein [Euryarchaeota archaeon]
MGMEGLVLVGGWAGSLALPALAGFFDFLKSRKRVPEGPGPGPSGPMFPAMEMEEEPGDPSDVPGEPVAAAGGPARQPGRKEHIAPRIVRALGPPPPEVRAAEGGRRPGLHGSQPRVAKVASEEEEEEGEMEDMAREAIESCRLMLGTLAQSGMDISVAERQLAKAESMLQQGLFPDAVNYASKAMDIAESLEADRDRCPKCHAETKPRWLLCPKCGHPLRLAP